MIGLDTEADDPDIKSGRGGAFRTGRCVGISLATEAGFKQYYPWGHEGGDNLDKAKVLAYVAEQMKLPQPKVGAHLLYDLAYLHVEGVRDVRGPLWDVQNAEPLLTEDRFRYDLEGISKDWLGVGKTDEALDEWLIQHFGKKNPKGSIHKAPGSVVAPYAADDAALPIEIFKKQRPELERRQLWDLFVLESKLIPMLLAMKARGVRIDLKKAHRMHDRLEKEIAGIRDEIKRATGGIEVEIWATKSIQRVFDSFGLEYPLTPKKKKASFTASFLEAHEHPVAGMIVEARRKDKLRGTFLEGGIFEAVVGDRIHCSFNQLKSDEGGAVSGRFSSSGPNLQFIPVRTEEGRLIRDMFLPDEGGKWWKTDWSQVEYRLIVHDAACLELPGAAEVVRMYRDDPDTDFHQAVAEMTGLSRGSAKTINFGLAYGEGVPKLARQLGIELREAEALIDEYHRRAPFIRRLSRYLMNIASREGEVRTLLNRARTFNTWEAFRKNPETGKREPFYVRHRIPGARRAFTHKALNARIQGSAADLMKKAMVDVWESGICADLGVPQLTVHDELDGTLMPGRAAKKALKELVHIMETVVPLEVPLKVDLGVGDTWGTIH